LFEYGQAVTLTAQYFIVALGFLPHFFCPSYLMSKVNAKECGRRKPPDIVGVCKAYGISVGQSVKGFPFGKTG
jgi:hypothetical protein